MRITQALERVRARRNAAARAMPLEADDALMDAYARGRLDALDRLAERYRLPLHRFAFRIVNHEAAAEDVVQETFVRLMQRAHAYNARGHFRTWLFTIAANLCKDELKRRARHSECSLDGLHELNREAPAAAGDGDALLRWHLTIALQTLSLEHRIALVLHHCQQFSYDEIGEVLGVPAGTVKSRVHYALEHVRKVMGVTTK